MGNGKGHGAPHARRGHTVHTHPPPRVLERPDDSLAHRDKGVVRCDAIAASLALAALRTRVSISPVPGGCAQLPKQRATQKRIIMCHPAVVQTKCWRAGRRVHAEHVAGCEQPVGAQRPRGQRPTHLLETWHVHRASLQVLVGAALGGAAALAHVLAGGLPNAPPPQQPIDEDQASPGARVGQEGRNEASLEVASCGGLQPSARWRKRPVGP